MRSIRKMIKRIDARLADMERERRTQPDWLTRLMLDQDADHSGQPVDPAPAAPSRGEIAHSRQ